MMKLRFDRGTILLTDPPQDLNLTEAPGVLWDPRVHAHRAPASRYTALKRWLLEGGVRFQDVTPPLRPIAEAWSDVDLRPYQEAALSAWELGTIAASSPSQRGVARPGSPWPPCIGRS